MTEFQMGVSYMLNIFDKARQEADGDPVKFYVKASKIINEELLREAYEQEKSDGNNG